MTFLGEEPLLTMDARLGYRDIGQQNWTEIVRATEERTLNCFAEKVCTSLPHTHLLILLLA